ncbi:MAG: hypothetical protein MK085_07765 [Phycisphaerales bacterium]|nr:hypothetical protein [Phycisphaerales bacterium]
MPEEVSLEDVDEAWAELCAANPRYHDGGVMHVLGVVRNGHGGVTMHLAESSYRFHAVRQAGIDTGIRPLGVKGIATHEGLALVGLRGAQTGSCPGRWEYVPGGGVEPPLPGEAIDSRAVVLKELDEESGWRAVGPVVAVAVFLDEQAGTWEIVHTLQVAPGDADVDGGAGAGWEYEELRLVQPGACPAPGSPASEVLDRLATSISVGA